MSRACSAQRSKPWRHYAHLMSAKRHRAPHLQRPLRKHSFRGSDAGWMQKATVHTDTQAHAHTVGSKHHCIWGNSDPLKNKPCVVLCTARDFRADRVKCTCMWTSVQSFPAFLPYSTRQHSNDHRETECFQLRWMRFTVSKHLEGESSFSGKNKPHACGQGKWHEWV